MLELSELSAAILAGGLGTRLRPVIPDQQKTVAPVGGRPFVTYLLDQLLLAGIQRVVICTGYRGTEVQAILGERYHSIQILYSHEDVPLGTGGALRLALPLLRSDPILVLNGDSICQADLNGFWRFHRRRAANLSILLVRATDTSAFGRVEIDRQGFIRSFAEKAKSGPGWINAGMYLINRRPLAEITPAKHVSMEHEVLPNWIGRGLFGYRSRGKFLDIGTPSSYAEAEGFFHYG